MTEMLSEILEDLDPSVVEAARRAASDVETSYCEAGARGERLPYVCVVQPNPNPPPRPPLRMIAHDMSGTEY